jgi:Arc/MetJ family transcription regulator
MRTTLNIDDDLYAQAVKLTGMKEKTALMSESLKALIERESARRLAALGGSEPNLTSIPRRQSKSTEQ